MLLVTYAAESGKPKTKEWTVNKERELYEAQAFIHLQDAIGLVAILEYASTACEVAAEGVCDEHLAQAWRQVAPDLEKIAKRVRQLEERTLSRRRWEDAAALNRMPGAFIGTQTTYLGGEWPTMAGVRVRIDAVFRQFEGSDDVFKIRTNSELRAAGGVSARDRIEVRPVKSGGQLSFIPSDPYALDLECFAPLRRPLVQTA